MTAEIYRNANTSKGVISIDKIQHYQNERYISASEAAKRLFSFPLGEYQTSVKLIEVNSEGHHIVYYK